MVQELNRCFQSRSSNMNLDLDSSSFIPSKPKDSIHRSKWHIPQIEWTCPPKFAIDSKWLVAAGEQSKEAEAEKFRETRVLEAVYPDHAAIPLNPSTSLSVEDQHYDDSHTRLIPIIPVEEEEEDAPAAELSPEPTKISGNSSQPVQDPQMNISPYCPPNSLKLPQNVSSKIPGNSAQPAKDRQMNFNLYCPPNSLQLPQNISSKISGNSPQPALDSQMNFSSYCPPNSLRLPRNVSSNTPQSAKDPSMNLNPHYPPNSLKLLQKASSSSLQPAKDSSMNLDSRCPPNSLKLLQQSSSKSPQSAQDPSVNLYPRHPPSSLKLPPPANSAPEKLHVEDDLVLAAATAVTAIVKSKEEGSLIDPDLLIQLLSDPKMTETLVKEHGLAANTLTGPRLAQRPCASSAPLPSSLPDLSSKRFGKEHGESQTPSISRPAAAESVNELSKPASTRHVSISQLPEKKRPFPLHERRAELVITKSTNGNGVSHWEPAPISWPTPSAKSAPVTSSFHSESAMKNTIAEHGVSARTGAVCVAGHERGTFPNPSNSKPSIDMIKKMINEYGTADGEGKEPFPRREPPVIPFSTPKSDWVTPSRASLPNKLPSDFQMKPLSAGTALTSSLSFTSPAPPVKDINYYKSLIKQHGETNETVDQKLVQLGKLPNHSRESNPMHNLKLGEQNAKYQRPCMYFNSPRGCRNGPNCPFQHTNVLKQWRSNSVTGSPVSKRMKLGGELVGRL